MAKIIIIPGSARSGSFNRKLATTIGMEMEAQGGSSTVINLADYPMPILNEDEEASSGAPENAKKLAALISEHQGVVLVHPEYNSTISPLMKNTLDWLSRDVGLKVYQKRVFALVACSPGSLGGIRVLSHARDFLVSVGADALTPQLAVSNAESAFAEDGSLTNERAQKLLKTLCETMIRRAGSVVV